MPLLAFNITGAQVTLVAGLPAPIIPASPSPPTRGPAVDVTKELRGLSDADYAALDAQRPNTIDYEWTGDAEYTLGVLTGSIGAPTHPPGNHATQHATAGPDPVVVDTQTATNQTATATNQNTTATNQPTTGTNQATTATNQSTTTGMSAVSTVATTQGTVAVSQDFEDVCHETFINPQAAGTTLATIVENVASVPSPSQPNHPANLRVDFQAGWEGGSIRVDGKDAAGVDVSEVFASNPGGTTTGSTAFASINPSGVVNLLPGGAGPDTAAIKTAESLGVASRGTVTEFYKLSVDGVDEAFAASNTTAKTFEPTTLKDGSRDFEVWYVVKHTHVQSSHTHTQDSHTHTLTDPGHNHTQDSHNHVQDPHNHTQDIHTHVQNGHTHVQDGHSHTTSG